MVYVFDLKCILYVFVFLIVVRIIKWILFGFRKLVGMIYMR